MSSNAPREIDVSGSILFLGSGFSRGAENIRGQNLPTGQELKNEFARLLGVDSDEYDLRTLADEAASHSDINLYQILYEIFTVKKLQNYQSDILSMPWRRIYTTNYDDSVEYYYVSNGKKVSSFNFDDEKPRKLPNGAIVHLHGIIRSTTEENVLDQLVLNESAYIRQHFEKSLWYDDFERDLRFCSACFFVGYSLADYHISALLMKNPATCEKTYFVTLETYPQIFANRVEPYGKILPVGVEGFASHCRSLPKPASTGNPHSVKTFRYLDPFRDKKTLAPPTALEVLNLVSYGTFNYQRCIATLPRAEYVVPRQRLVEDAAALLRGARCLLVHSRIGNGKSIFLYLLAHKLSEQGYKCFLCRHDPVIMQPDIKLLQSFRNLALFFDSYNSAIQLIGHFAQLLPEAKFIVAVRTGVQEVRLHEIQSRLPTPLQRLNLNGMQQGDVVDFKKLLNRSGIRVPSLEDVIDRSKDFRDVVVALYDNDTIKEKLKRELAPLLEDKNFKKTFISSLLLEWVGQEADAAFLRSVTLNDPYAEITKFRETAGDVFTIDDDNLQARSALFSIYLLQNHFDSSDIIECVFLIVVEAVKRKAEGRYQAILSKLLRFSDLEFLIGNDRSRLSSLVSFYERLRRDIDVNKEPLFWLQYSILMTAANDLQAAEVFIRTAYDRAGESPGFRTFQIDTFALRLLLLVEQRDEGSNKVERFDQIIEKLERVQSIIAEESQRPHAIRVLEGIEPFVAARLSEFSTNELNTLVYYFNLLIDHFNHLSPDARAQSGSDEVRAGIFRAKERILAYNTK